MRRPCDQGGGAQKNLRFFAFPGLCAGLLRPRSFGARLPFFRLSLVFVEPRPDRTEETWELAHFSVATGLW